MLIDLSHDVVGALPDSGFRFFAVAVKVRAMGTFPVRAFALVP